MRVQLFSRQNELTHPGPKQGEGSNPTAVIFLTSSKLCFYFFDLPDVMPEVGEARSLILFYVTSPLCKKKKKRGLVLTKKWPHNSVRHKTTFDQQNIVCGNPFSTVIKKTTTTSKWHFSCGYEINDPIQTNLPS